VRQWSIDDSRASSVVTGWRGSGEECSEPVDGREGAYLPGDRMKVPSIPPREAGKDLSHHRRQRPGGADSPQEETTVGLHARVCGACNAGAQAGLDSIEVGAPRTGCG
jgi:hypothetical protein